MPYTNTRIMSEVSAEAPPAEAEKTSDAAAEEPKAADVVTEPVEAADDKAAPQDATTNGEKDVAEVSTAEEANPEEGNAGEKSDEKKAAAVEEKSEDKTEAEEKVEETAMEEDKAADSKEVKEEDNDNTASKEEKQEETSDDEKQTIQLLAERLRFFFSNANLRQDKWMRKKLEFNPNNAIDIDSLLKFQTIKKISTNKSLLAKAALHDDVKDLIIYDEDKQTIRRCVTFDWKTMGDGSSLSLFVKNIPLTEPPADEGTKKEEGDKMEVDKDFKPSYAVTRDEVKALFEPFGRVGIVNLRFGRRDSADKEDEKYISPGGRGSFRRGESYPLGSAIVEFDSMEGMEKACSELLPPEEDESKDKENEEGGDKEADTKAAKTTLEIKGAKLVVEKMKQMRMFRELNEKNNKRKERDGDGNSGRGKTNGKEENESKDEKFTEFKMDWEKGCVISLSGLSEEKCDRESIREAVSDILGVTKDVKTSGLYVDFNRGSTSGHLRLKEPKEAEMKTLVEKLKDGSVLIADSKVEEAKILEGEEEEKYWEEFIKFMNNRKKQRSEEKFQNKRQKKWHGRGR